MIPYIPIERGSKVLVDASEAQSDSIRRFLESGKPPVTPKQASTVMLVRPNGLAGRLEVFMMRRSKSMAFVPDAMVFPGGSVSDDDSLEDARWVGPTPQEWAETFGIGADLARRIVVAAVRELFEETGVLLAGTPDKVCTVAPDWLEKRRLIESHELSFRDFLAAEGLCVRSDLLCARSHWVTPEFASKRYDTFFFAAALPEGQKAFDVSIESVTAAWFDPAWVVSCWERRELSVMPPTVYNLKCLREAMGTGASLRNRDIVGSTMLRPVKKGDGSYFLTGEV